MAEPFIGEIKLISFNFPPKGWAFCDGQVLPINQNQALFSIMGTTYGGNGQTTFALPNLKGRTPVHIGQGITQGQATGEANHTLILSEMPQHVHLAQGDPGAATAGTPGGNTWAAQASNPYSSATPDAAMNSGAIGNSGGSQPHTNTQPYLVLNFIVALVGIFPSRN